MLNKVELIGHLGAKPTIRYTAEKDPVASFSVATSQRWRDKNNEIKEHTEWHLIVAFGKTADNIGKYLSKGSKVQIEGKLKTRSYDDKEGNKRYVTEVIVRSFLMLDKKDDKQPAPKTDTEAPKDYMDNLPSMEGDYDNDIPF